MLVELPVCWVRLLCFWSLGRRNAQYSMVLLCRAGTMWVKILTRWAWVLQRESSWIQFLYWTLRLDLDHYKAGIKYKYWSIRGPEHCLCRMSWRISGFQLYVELMKNGSLCVLFFDGLGLFCGEDAPGFSWHWWEVNGLFFAFYFLLLNSRWFCICRVPSFSWNKLCC